MTKIEHGCEKDRFNPYLYRYVEVRVKYHIKDYQSIGEDDTIEIVHIFGTQPGDVPEIGDFIEQGVLVKRKEPQVNNDWSKWKDKDL